MAGVWRRKDAEGNWVAQSSFTPTSVYTTGTLAATSGTVEVPMNAEDIFTQTLTGDPSYSTINRVEGSSVLVRIAPGGADRAPTFPSGWTWVGPEPEAFTAGQVGLLSLLMVGGTAESDVLAAFAEEVA